MIFDALLNAAYRVSLRGRGPGAEIERGSQQPPLPSAGGGKSRGTAGRAFKDTILSQISTLQPISHLEVR